jgi:S1-C subfamily serine protease
MALFQRPTAGLLTVVAVLGVACAPAHASPSGSPVDPSLVATRVTPTLVDINSDLEYAGATGAGTGIVVNPGGEVLTNNHVIEGATSITATAIGTGRSYPADVIGYDRNHDIAMLQLRGASDLGTAPLGDSAQVLVGDSIIGIGNAGGSGGVPTSAPGSVIGLNQTVSVSDDLSGSAKQLAGLIQVDADYRPGDSGGALVNSAAQVIGINTAATPGYQMGSRGGQGFAIPIDEALSIAEHIRTGAASNSVHIGETAFLGVGVADGTSPGPSSMSGALVQRVLSDSPADHVGLRGGDLIVAVDGTPIDSATALTDKFDQHHPGDNVALGWLDRSDQQRTATVTLVSGPAG